MVRDGANPQVENRSDKQNPLSAASSCVEQLVADQILMRQRVGERKPEVVRDGANP